MALTSSTILETGKTAVFQAPRTNTYQVTWRMETDNPTDGEITLYQDGQAIGTGGTPHPTPALYDTYDYFGEQDPNAFAMTFNYSRESDASRTRWLCQVTYRQLQPGEDPGQNVDDPLQRPALYWVEFENTTEEIYEALLVTDLSATMPDATPGTLRPFMNACGDKITDSVQIPRQYTIYAIQKNYATADEIAALGNKYANKRNKAVWRDFPAGSVLFRSIQAGQPYYEQGAQYYQAVIRMVIDTQNFHNIQLPHRGMRYTPIQNNLTALRDWDGATRQKLTQPVWLDLDGTLLNHGPTFVPLFVQYEEDNLITFGPDLP